MIEMSMEERYPWYRTLPFGWFGIAYSDELAVGEIKSLRYFGRELIAWRDQEGQGHVMDAFCPHLGAHLGYGGRVDGCRLVCPFHGWEWNTDGSNASIPYSDMVQKVRVKTYPSVERNGLLMAWYHPEDAEPSWEIPVLEEYANENYRPYVKRDWEICTTWQDTAENGADYVHLRFVHNTPVLPKVLDYSTEGAVNRVLLGVTYYTPKGDVTGTIQTETHGPGFSIARFQIGDFARLLMIDWCTPIDLKRIRDHKAYSVHQDTKESVGQGFIGDLTMQMEQDIQIFENKRYIDQPPLVKGDGPIAKFRRWASQFYVA